MWQLLKVFSIVMKGMALNESRIMSRRAWSNLTWVRLWKLEDATWRASNVILKVINLLTLNRGDTEYVTWWYISELDYRLTRMCETMGKITCHASRLKRDDGRLRCIALKISYISLINAPSTIQNEPRCMRKSIG